MLIAGTWQYHLQRRKRDRHDARAVSFIAARDITSGTGGGKFSPDDHLKCGDFLVLLMKAYGITPDTSPADNFSDAGYTYYTGYLVKGVQLCPVSTRTSDFSLSFTLFN